MRSANRPAPLFRGRMSCCAATIFHDTSPPATLCPSCGRVGNADDWKPVRATLEQVKAAGNLRTLQHTRRRLLDAMRRDPSSATGFGLLRSADDAIAACKSVLADLEE